MPVQFDTYYLIRDGSFILETVDCGQVAILEAIPESGYQFEGWLVNGEELLDEQITITITGRTNIFAIFSET